MTHNLSTAAFAAIVFGISPSQAVAQVACFAGIVPDACTVAQGETVTGRVLTNGDGHSIGNSGVIAGSATTIRANSRITNSGVIGRNALADRENSSIINSGVIEDSAISMGANGVITNSGTIERNASIWGINGEIVNSGVIEGSITMSGRNPTLSLLGGSVIGSNISLRGGGISTINVGVGQNLDIRLSAGQPDVLSAREPFVQSGNRLLVLDPTGFAASDVIVGNLTSAIFNAVGASDASGGVLSGVVPLVGLVRRRVVAR